LFDELHAGGSRDGFAHGQQPEDTIHRYWRTGIQVCLPECALVDDTLVGRAQGYDAGNRFVVDRLPKSTIDWGKRTIGEVLSWCAWSYIGGNGTVAQQPAHCRGGEHA